MKTRKPIVQLCEKAVRGLLNRISPDNFELLIARGDPATGKKPEWLEIYNPKFVSSIVDILFDKAVEEPTFCSLYSDICKLQIDNELKIQRKDKKSTFRDQLLQKAQRCFQEEEEEFNVANAKLKEAEKRLAEIEARNGGKEPTTEEGKTEFKKAKDDVDELTEKRFKMRRRQFGNIQFIGQLYPRQCIVVSIVNHCFIILYKRVKEAQDAHDERNAKLAEKDRRKLDDDSIRCTYQLLGSVGVTMLNDKAGVSRLPKPTFLGKEATPENALGTYLGWLTPLKPNVINKHRFAIEDIEKLGFSKQAWSEYSAKSSLAPKKKIDVAREKQRQIAAEQLAAQQQVQRPAAYATRGSYGAGPPQGTPPVRQSVSQQRPMVAAPNVTTSRDTSRAVEYMGQKRLSAAFGPGGRPAPFGGRDSGGRRRKNIVSFSSPNFISRAAPSREQSATRKADQQAALEAAKQLMVSTGGKQQGMSLSHAPFERTNLEHVQTCSFRNSNRNACSTSASRCVISNAVGNGS